MMQYMTGSYLTSTPHKVGLNTSERFAFAYFHEPNFASVIKPLRGYDNNTSRGKAADGGIHYGTHFTNMCLRNYPDRVTTQKLLREDRCTMLSLPELRRGDGRAEPKTTADAAMRDGCAHYPAPSVEMGVA